MNFKRILKTNSGLTATLPYGLVVWLRRKFWHEQEDFPLLHYHGIRKRIRRFVKFCLPYFFVKRYQRSPNVQYAAMRTSMLNERSTPVSFPVEAVTVARSLSDSVPNGRTAVFAMFSKDGQIKTSTLYYISKLGDIADNVVVFGDCPIIPDEVSSLPSIVRYCSFRRHGEYDFGSYKRGFEYVMSHPVLAGSKELLFCNDSCYGPITPFSDVFEKMADVNCDFWGLCENYYGRRHLQSYFLLFKRKVFCSRRFASFMRNIRKKKSVAEVILNYEISLTPILEKNGFVGKSAFHIDGQERTYINPTVFPVSLMQLGCPLVKVKALRGSVDNFQGIEETLAVIHAANSELWQIIMKER